MSEALESCQPEIVELGVQIIIAYQYNTNQNNHCHRSEYDRVCGGGGEECLDHRDEVDLWQRPHGQRQNLTENNELNRTTD